MNELARWPFTGASKMFLCTSTPTGPMIDKDGARDCLIFVRLGTHWPGKNIANFPLLDHTYSTRDSVERATAARASDTRKGGRQRSAKTWTYILCSPDRTAAVTD